MHACNPTCRGNRRWDCSAFEKWSGRWSSFFSAHQAYSYSQQDVFYHHVASPHERTILCKWCNLRSWSRKLSQQPDCLQILTWDVKFIVKAIGPISYLPAIPWSPGDGRRTSFLETPSSTLYEDHACEGFGFLAEETPWCKSGCFVGLKGVWF